MTFSRLIFTFLILISSKIYSQIPEQLQNTIWEQEGYDRVLKINRTTYSYYNSNEFNCSILAEGDFNGRFEIIKINSSKLILNPGGIVNYRFNKVRELPNECVGSRIKDESFESNFKSFWRTFNDNYAFFDKRQINWNAIYEEYFPKVEKISSQKEFALILNEIIAKFQDGHINLEIPSSVIDSPNSFPSKNTSLSKEKIQSDILKKYVDQPKSYNNGVIKWGKLKDKNIGYIGISDMNDFANYVPKKYQNTDKFDSIFNSVRTEVNPLEYFEDEINGVNKILPIIIKDLESSNSIILDLRFNGGGYEKVALELLSHFVDKEKEIMSIKAKKENGFTPIQSIKLEPKQNSAKPIYLLISPFTASAAEIFALGSLSYSNIEIFGEQSSGIFSEILWKKLPIGWEFSLSNEVYLDPTGRSYEGEGIPVDKEFNYSKDRIDFYQSFYSNKKFNDRLLEEIKN